MKHLLPNRYLIFLLLSISIFSNAATNASAQQQKYATAYTGWQFDNVWTR